jgi:hypothetical protein
MTAVTIASTLTIPVQGTEVYTVTSAHGTNWRATFTASPATAQQQIGGTGRTYGPLATSQILGPFNAPGTLVIENLSSSAALNVTMTGGYVMPATLYQSAVPVMIAQSSQVQASGLMVPGALTATVTVGLSATSGAGVTVTLGTALLTGTSADNGKQITVYDAASSVWRSALITAFSSTTVATCTLVGTWSSTSIAATSVAVGNPLPTNYAGTWVYLPASAVSGGIAGFYWATATSTATANGVLQVTTTYQSAMGVPYIPSGPFVNAVGSGSNFTQSTSYITLVSATVLGGSLGANGRLYEEAWWSASSGGVSKGVILQYGGVALVSGSFGANFTTLGLRQFGVLTNRGTQNANTYNSSVAWGGVGAPFTNSNIDTSVNQQVIAQAQLTQATDFVVLEAFTTQVFPGV